MARWPSLPGGGESELTDSTPGPKPPPGSGAPQAVGGPVITIAPGKHRMPRRRGMARAALSAAIQRPALTDPDWPLSEAGPRPQWDGPPLMPPDHPSAPVPRVRAPLLPSAGGAGRSPARSSSPGLLRSRPNSGPPRPPQRMPGGQPNLGTAARRPSPRAHDHGPGQYPGPPARFSARPAPRGDTRRQDVEQEAAVIRREATAIRQAAEKEAAHLRAIILSLSEQLGQMSAYIRENVASTGDLATMSAPTIAPPRPRPAPPRPRTTPGTPSARPSSLAGQARPTPGSVRKPQTQGRQFNAMRIATAATATLLAFAVTSAGVEIGTFGFKFFTFRSSGTGETGPNPGTDQQFLARQAAAKATVAHRPGKHSAKTTSGS
jgi:hypothetical protein